MKLFVNVSCVKHIDRVEFQITAQLVGLGFDSNSKFDYFLAFVEFRNLINLTEFESNPFSKCSGSPPPVPLFPLARHLRHPSFSFFISHIAPMCHVPHACGVLLVLCAVPYASECQNSVRQSASEA